jgi:hypothetical protein
MVIILGSFGIASVDKWLNKKDKDNGEENSNNSSINNSEGGE